MNKFVLFILLKLLAQIFAEDAISYKNFRLYQVSKTGFRPLHFGFPEKKNKLLMLTEIHEFDEKNRPYTVRSYLVPEDEEKAFQNTLKRAGAAFSVLVPDLEKEIVEERRSLGNYQRRTFSGVNDVSKNYYSHEEMVSFLSDISKIKNPITGEPIALVEPIGRSHQGREMHIVKISSDHSAENPVLFIEAGIHAREWTAPATALYVISQLVSNYTHTSEALDGLDYYIIPISNPDGYEYSRAKDRLWRKTRSYYRGRFGVDGNRNFDFHWGEAGSSTNPSSEIFQGPKPFSEAETKNIRDAGRKYRNRLAGFLSVHAFGPSIVYPWSYKKSCPAPDVDDLAKVAQKAVQAIKKYNGTTYKHGVASVLMYEASGGADDYFKGVLGVDLAFTMELSSAKRMSFIVPADNLHGIVAEAFEGIKAIGRGVLEHQMQSSGENAIINLKFIPLEENW